QREQAVGLSTTAYLLAKSAIFCLFATAQAGIAVLIVIIGKGAPTQGSVFFGKSHVAAGFELFLTVAATCVASAMVGLAMSAVARSSEQVMPLLVVSIMSQLVLGGGMIPVTGRIGLDQLSWLTPGRWGYAAGASTVDINALMAEVPQIPHDSHWKHTHGAWLLDMGMLAFLSITYGSFIRWKIRLQR
ncbi:MAG: ABC transporter permease, partial [Mycobacterium sp.]